MADTLIRYAAEDGVAVFTIDDPPANTYTYEMMRDLDDAILRARFDENVHVIVIRGEGDRFFSAGANIKMLQTSDPYFKYFFCLHANETLTRLEHTPKLVIGALNGHTVGRRTRDRARLRHPDRPPRRGEDRAAGGKPRRPPGDGRDAAARPAAREAEGHRVDGGGPHVRVRGGAGAGAREQGVRGR